MGAAHAGGNPRHAYRAVTDSVGLIFNLVYPVALNRLADDSEHVRGRGPRRTVTIVDRDAAIGVAVVLGGHVDDHLTVAGDGRACGFDDV